MTPHDFLIFIYYWNERFTKNHLQEFQIVLLHYSYSSTADSRHLSRIIFSIRTLCIIQKIEKILHWNRPEGISATTIHHLHLVEVFWSRTTSNNDNVQNTMQYIYSWKISQMIVYHLISHSAFNTCPRENFTQRKHELVDLGLPPFTRTLKEYCKQATAIQPWVIFNMKLPTSEAPITVNYGL